MQTLGVRADRELGVHAPLPLLCKGQGTAAPGLAAYRAQHLDRSVQDPWQSSCCHFQQPWHKAGHLRAVVAAACWG